MSNNIFSESIREVSEELSLTPAQVIDSINKWTAINLKLQQHVEEMKQEHIASMKQEFTTAQMVELDPQAFDAEPVEVYEEEVSDEA